MKKLLVISVLILAGVFISINGGIHPPATTQSSNNSSKADQLLASFYKNRQSNIQVQGSGRVVRILPDDNDGSRHQKFIIQLDSGQTLLIAHNIDLAKRVKSLRIGGQISFYGEYAWNSQGGTIHWTHRDPHGHHTAGWIKHDGVTYQ